MQDCKSVLSAFPKQIIQFNEISQFMNLMLYCLNLFIGVTGSSYWDNETPGFVVGKNGVACVKNVCTFDR